jgi:serine/threonine protein kinase
VDVWAIGIIAYQLFNAKRNGKIPFPFLDPDQMRKKINVYGDYIDYNSYIALTNVVLPCDEELPI